MAGIHESNQQRHRLLNDTNITEVEISEKGIQKISGPGCGWRHVVTFMIFLGLACIYTLRMNLSVAVVTMVNHTALQMATFNAQHSHQTFSVTVNSSEQQLLCGESLARNWTNSAKDGPFIWDENVQGLILASFFYGYIFTQIPSGFLTGIFGGKWIFGISVLLPALLTLLTPLAVRYGPGCLIALRALEGLAAGMIGPAAQSLFANWAPPSERTQLPAFALSGTLFGTVSAFIISALLANSDFLGGWPAVFYVFGIVGCVWFVLWTLFVESSPQNHRWISKKERKYITSSLKAESRVHRVNWCSIKWRNVLTSLPLWAAIFSHFTSNWCNYVLLTGLPTYFKQVLGFDTKANGFLCSMPYLCQACVRATAGKTADILRERYSISTTNVRKIFDCSGHLLPAIFILAVGYIGCDRAAAVCLLTLAVGTSGLAACGHSVNFLDLGPRMASVTYSISNTIATIPGIIAPSVTGAFIEGAYGVDAVNGWRKVFCIAAGLYILSTVFYFMFASGEIQPWATTQSNTKKSTMLCEERTEADRLNQSEV